MKISKLSLIILSSLFFIFSQKIATSCGWFYEEDEMNLSPFNQFLVDLPKYEPFFYSYHYLSNHDETTFSDESENIADWNSHFNHQFTDGDLIEVIYATSKEDYETLNAAINGAQNSTIYSENEVVDYWRKGNGRSEFLYLLFAKSVEPFVQAPDYWEPKPLDTIAYEMLKATALLKLKAEQNPFLQLRYAFQAMRLHHYSGQFDACIQLYNQYVENNTSPSIMRYWCLALKAGAQIHKKQFAEASYNNSLVFSNSLAKRRFAERDFYLPNETEWQNSLTLCKTENERLNMWLLTAINQKNMALNALEQMLLIDASSEQVELVLAREIEKFQRNKMPNRWAEDFSVKSDDNYANKPLPLDSKNLLAFIQKGLATAKVRTPSFWQSCAAYIAYTEGQNKTALAFAQQAIKSAGTQHALFDQAKILECLITLETVITINDANKQLFLEKLIWLKENALNTQKQDAYKLAHFKLYTLYAKNGNAAEAEICKSNFRDYYDLYADFNAIDIDELYYFLNASNKSPLDQFLTESFAYNSDDLLEIRATVLMRNANWNGAINLFNSRQSTGLHNKGVLLADPFTIHIKDCHDCDYETNTTSYTKLSLCQKIVSLETKIKSDPQNAATNFHLLANAYYNLSHFGNSWMALNYYLDTNLFSWYTNSDKSWPLIQENGIYFNNSTALNYYKLAIENTEDVEFAAQNCFMAAKCEQNALFTSGLAKTKNNDFKYKTYFAQLQKKYGNTNYIQQVIGECKYYNYYAKN